MFPIQFFVPDQEIRTQAEQHLTQAIEAQYVRFYPLYVSLQIRVFLPYYSLLLYLSRWIHYLNTLGTIFVGFMCRIGYRRKT